jgi:hypothetical protein
MRAPRLDDLFPDGLPISVDWDQWDVGMSVFVPTLKPALAATQARAVARRKNYTLECRTAVENQHLGVRIWRIT